MNWILQEPIIIQGINEPGVADCVAKMKAYGTNIVAGVTVGKQKTTIQDLPLFNLVEEVAAELDQVKTSLIFVPPDRVLDAAKEAIASSLTHLLIITKRVPALDMIRLLQAKPKDTLILGSGSCGVLVPEKACLGTLQSEYFSSGSVALISCSEFLTYEVAWELKQQKIGNSYVVDLGNDPILGSDLSQWLTFLDRDSQTETIVLIQQVKDLEKFAVDLIETKIDKPIVTYIAGLQTPQTRVLQNAADIVESYLSGSLPNSNTNKKIINKLKKAGIAIAENPAQIAAVITD
ncbi:MAG TPA: CoA-binding protein [Xenococcaceae cyanobacterium]